DLVVIVLGERGIGMIADRADGDILDRVGWLLKEERRLAIGVRTHFARMRGIVSPDAVDPPHRKHVGFTHDRDGRRANRKNRFRAGAPRLCWPPRPRRPAPARPLPGWSCDRHCSLASSLFYESSCPPASTAFSPRSD